MKVFSGKKFIGTMLLVLMIILCAAPALAAESWASDPKTGCQIGWESDNFTLVTVSWSGPVVDSKAEGKGRLTLTLRDKDGTEVTGKAGAELKKGKLDGNVDLKWSDGESYRGFFRDGKMDGKGSLKYNNGNSYDGDFKDGKREGNGVFKWKNGDIYQGDLKADLPNGKGLYKWKNGNVYEGDFKDGNKSGKGVLKYKDKDHNGDVYEGDFKDDLQNGKGVYKSKDGYSWEGEYNRGNLNGYGTFKDRSGTIIYAGLWKDGRIISMNAKEKFISI
jgi:hypothetical protein